MSPKKKQPRKTPDFSPHTQHGNNFPCHAEGCREAGIYKAPKSRVEIDEYLWFCLEHIRERNKSWDFFSGMKSEEIEAFIHDSVTGHRPTWNRESLLRNPHAVLQDKLYEFMHGKPAAAPKQHIPAKIRNALATMELDYPYTAKQLKERYRILVKKHHPDMNKGDKLSEEKFKKITAAYKYLNEKIDESKN